jgi:RNA polymerase-binding transcription factor DksA
VIGRPAVPGKPALPGKPAVGGKAVPLAKARVPKLVPATAEARALAAQAARAGRSGGKNRAAGRPEPEVRPLGVLPASAQARPRVAATARVSVPARSITAPGIGRKPQPVRKGDDRLTPEDLQYFEQRLLEHRARITREMGHIENTVLKVNPRDAAGELSGYSYHMADAGTDSMEREKAFDIASKEGRLLLEIDDALRRLYGGTYGICEISGKPIGRARLEALPWARLSLDEQEKLEKEQRAGRSLSPGSE